MEIIDYTFSSEASTQSDQPVLLLSIHNAEDRRLIKKFLPDYLTIEISNNGIAGRNFDLCIMDLQSFKQNKTYLQKHKEQASPIFLPFLLLSQNTKTVRTNPSVLELADDVVPRIHTAIAVSY